MLMGTGWRVGRRTRGTNNTITQQIVFARNHWSYFPRQEVPEVRERAEISIRGNKVEKAMLSFAHSVSPTTLFQVLIPSRSVHQQTHSPHTYTHRHMNTAEHICRLPAVWVSISLLLTAECSTAAVDWIAVDLSQETSRMSTAGTHRHGTVPEMGDCFFIWTLYDMSLYL